MERKEERRERIVEACEMAACSDKIAKIHFDQYVHHRWDPHPPKDFLEWWENRGRSTRAVTAWNCQCYREEWYEVKLVLGAA